MTSWVRSLLSENQDVSCMRFMAISALYFSFGLTIMVLILGKDLSSWSGTIMGFAVLGFGGKYAQKHEEVKEHDHDTGNH